MNRKITIVFVALMLGSGLALQAAETGSYVDQHECTSWIVMPDRTGGKCMMVHKNRDSRSRKLHFYRGSEPGKNSWISISNLNSKTPYGGLNDKGLAVVMNSGDPSPFFRKEKGLGTPKICRSALENCSTAAEAVEHIRQIIKAGNYSHSHCGSIWLLGDGKKAFIIEHDARNFTAHEVKSGFAARGNSWSFPEMIVYSKIKPEHLAHYTLREYRVRETLFGNGTKYKEPVTHEKIAIASRIDRISDDPKCYPLCGNITISGATMVIDCEYPADLSTMFAAFGPPRHTVYLPVPILCRQFPEELTSGKFSNAVFARFDAKRELLPQDKLLEFERVLNRRHETALEKARAVLKKGGPKARENAGKILTEAFRLNWEAVKKLSEGK